MPITPTPGTAALAAGMPLVPGTGLASDIDEYINQTRDFIAQRTSTVTPVAKGGTGATNATAARTNLAAVGTDQIAPGNAAQAGKIPSYNTSAQLTTADPSLSGHATSKGYVDGQVAGRLPIAGGTVTGDFGVVGNIFVPNASPATSGWAIAYINSDGRLSKGASSERYKKYISAIDPTSLGDIWPDLARYQMKGGDGDWKYGWIAERLDESDDLRPFVVYDAEERPDSIDFIALLIAQNSQLHDRLTALETERE